jgi:succinate dehydrogenase / fumarate reductase cytochrome b subunit
MQRSLTLYDASIGKKAVVALTGVVLFGFVITHMLGNLQIFWGPEALNGYAQSLRRVPALLWLARLILLGSVIAHIVASLQLVRGAQLARPVAYQQIKRVSTSYAARTMQLSGPLLAAFILYHLAHLTIPGLSMGAYAHDPHDVYANLVNGFRVPWVVGVYVVAQLLLGAHLYHGAWSLFQTLGLSHPRYDRWRVRVPQAVAFTVVLGNLAIPLAVLLGIVR